ncbi:MAG TPA: SGNH/GDSL hydrolase family protein [Candidatus Obscuribacterales bacterium]
MKKLNIGWICASALLVSISSQLPVLATVQPTNPAVQSGLVINSAARAVTVMPGSIYVNDKLVSVASPQQIAVPAAPPETLRLDTLYISDTGTVALAAGKPRKMAPEPAVIPENSLALAHVVVRGATNLSDNNILPISRDASTTLFSDRTQNQKALAKTLAKLKANQPVKLLFWGDSITCGANASAPELGYAVLAEKMIRHKFHADQMVVKNLGIGGTSVDTRLDKLEPDLKAFQPDVMVVEFVNDIRVPIDKLDQCYAKVNELAKNYNIEVLYINPFYPSPTLCKLHSFSDEALGVPYYQFVRDKSKQYGWALADAAKRWDTVQREGYTCDLLLQDGVVHLNDQGHHMLAEEVFKCFR